MLCLYNGTNYIEVCCSTYQVYLVQAEKAVPFSRFSLHICLTSGCSDVVSLLLRTTSGVGSPMTQAKDSPPTAASSCI